MASDGFRLFEAVGIELEYMIVSAETLDVSPRADWLLASEAGGDTDEVVRGPVAWNNELALHVLELKCAEPAAQLSGLAEAFGSEVTYVNGLLASEGLQLLPTAMHPWMDPVTEVKLWPHSNREIYRAFDQVFGCNGHGWGNLQSMHINLPFSDDAEFGRLHAAVRLVLPILPGLAASSPIVDGVSTEQMDSRLHVYRSNCARVPSVTGAVVPEPVFSIEQYQRDLLGDIYRDLAPLDPAGVLRHEWVNARGAIARFDRMALEIRVIDVQECPRADLAIANVVVELVRMLCEEQWCALRTQQSWEVAPLERIFSEHVVNGDQAGIGDRDYLRCFGYHRSSEARSARLWESIIEAQAAAGVLLPDTQQVMEHYLRHGCLARRIVAALSGNGRPALTEVYRRLAGCLADATLL